MAESRATLTDTPLRITADNIGGIDHTEHELPPGITILKGENATNRSSFLQAIMAGLGSDRVSLKSDSDEGQVTLDTDGETYTRTLTRVGQADVATGGDPYLSDDDATLADLYAFLVEDNEVRRAVERGDDLYEILMRPVDKADIEARQNELRTQRRDLETEIESAKAAADELIGLEEQKTSLESTIADLEAELNELETDIEELEQTVDEADTNDEIDALQDEIDARNAELHDLEAEIHSKKNQIEVAEQHLAEIDIPDISEDELHSRKAALQDEKEEIYGEINTLDTRLNQVSDAQLLNQDIIEGRLKLDRILSTLGDGAEIPFGPLTEANGSGNVTDQLTDDDTVFCQACGSMSDAAQVEAVQSQYQAIHEALRAKRTALDDDRDDFDDEIAAIDEQLESFAEAKTERADLKDRISRYEAQIEVKQEDIDELEAEIADLEAERDALEPSPLTEELIEKKSSRQATQAEFERVQAELADTESAIADKEAAADREADLREQKEAVTAELEDLNGKIDEIEQGLVEQFNDQMGAVIELLDYENIARVRLDRRRHDTGGRGSKPKTEFELTITREDDGGAVYEDRLANLSESERNVIGLVVALTGYLVHDVQEISPVMLLDSIEMMDGARINRLIDYFSTYQAYLVAALLPGDADAITLDAATMIDW